MTVNTTHTQPVWTEIEYTALCKNPYLSTPFYVPKESKVFQCKEDGSRKEARMLYLVFKAANAPEVLNGKTTLCREKSWWECWMMTMKS